VEGKQGGGGELSPLLLLSFSVFIPPFCVRNKEILERRTTFESGCDDLKSLHTHKVVKLSFLSQTVLIFER
jgi:hypothetical protein